MRISYFKFSLLVPIAVVISSSMCFAQDTIAFKSGEKDAVKIISFSKKKINFSLEDTAYSVNEGRINYIKYKNITYSFKDLSAKFDSADKVSNAEMDKNDSTDNRPINANVGVGGSSIESEIVANDGIETSGLGPYLISQSPVYNCVIEYRFIRFLSIGVGATYQSVTDNPSEEPSSYNVNPAEIEKITKINYSGRILYHFLKHTTVDVYAGVRLGESMWKEQIASNSQPVGATIFTTPVPSSAQFSYQFIAGFIIPLYHCLGVHAEVGAGTPYFIEAGITLQIKTKK